MELYPTGRNTSRLTNGTLDDLRTRLGKGHTFYPRLRAEADNQYPPKDPMLGYLFNYYGFLEVLNEDLTHFLDELQDSWDATSTKGKLGYLRKVQVRDQLNREIAEFEAKNQKIC
jgi:predicted transcriptional regulator